MTSQTAQHSLAPTGLFSSLSNPSTRAILLLNVVAPFAAYQFGTSHGLSEMQGLELAAVFPLIALLHKMLTKRRLDVFGGISLAAIVLGLAAGMLSSDPRILLVKDSFMTGGIGLAFLTSLLAPRPLVFLFAKQFTADDPAQRARMDGLWQIPAVRSRMRRMTVVWGLALVAEAAIRLGLSFVLAPATLLAISPILAAATFGPLAIWTARARARAVAPASR